MDIRITHKRFVIWPNVSPSSLKVLLYIKFMFCVSPMRTSCQRRNVKINIKAFHCNEHYKRAGIIPSPVSFSLVLHVLSAKPTKDPEDCSALSSFIYLLTAFHFITHNTHIESPPDSLKVEGLKKKTSTCENLDILWPSNRWFIKTCGSDIRLENIWILSTSLHFKTEEELGSWDVEKWRQFTLLPRFRLTYAGRCCLYLGECVHA